MVSTVKKSVCEDACRLGTRNSVQLGPSRRGAGPTPWRERTLRTLVAETVTAELSQLADDAEISPTGFSLAYPASSKDELDGLGRRRWAPRLAARIGSSASERVGGASRRIVAGVTNNDDQAVARDETGEQRNKGAVGPGESRLLDPVAEDRELVTQNHDLHVLRKGFSSGGTRTNSRARHARR